MAVALEQRALAAVLFAISASQPLRQELVLKGGNALARGHGSVRASVDLDFTPVTRFTSLDDASQQAYLRTVCERLTLGLAQAEAQYGLFLTINSSRVLPASRPTRRFPALDIRVGYGARRRKEYASVVYLEVSIEDIICDYEVTQLGDATVLVASLNDIIAEKLRAVLQQVPRDRRRPKDIYDIWYAVTCRSNALDLAQIAKYLIAKADGRLDRVAKAMFLDPDVRARSSAGYDQIKDTLEDEAHFPDFDVAFEALIGLVARLKIPDQ